MQALEDKLLQGSEADHKALEAALAKCAAAEGWKRQQAREWWQQREAAKAEKTMVMPEAKPQ